MPVHGHGAMITMTMTGADVVQGKIRNFVKYSQEDAEKITQEYGKVFQQAVKRNASGPPGPNVVTGQYVGSIQPFSEDQYTAGAETSAPQAARLEFGFVGVDALGRHYAQPPFPHWRPAIDEVGPKYKEAMQAAVRKWWR